MASNLIVKILRPEEWVALEQVKETRGSAADQADGFIHFSTPEQVPETLARHYQGEDDLILATLDPDALGDALKWEPSRGGALFPHLYGPLRRTDIMRHISIQRGPDGVFVLPDDLCSQESRS